GFYGSGKDAWDTKPKPLEAATWKGLMVIDLGLELHRRAKALRHRSLSKKWEVFALAGDTLRAKAFGAPSGESHATRETSLRRDESQ
ncbi:unnamed protein product, partial [Durusdinium trenchii]